jgi:hypothetical protein
MNEFNDFWVFNEAGLCLFNFPNQKNQDSTLIGGFITAITAFSETLNMSNIQSMNLGEHIILFSKDTQSKLLFVGRVSKTPDDIKYQEIMESIKIKFLHQFPCDYIRYWDGDVNHFSGFEIDLKDFFQKYVVNKK